MTATATVEKHSVERQLRDAQAAQKALAEWDGSPPYPPGKGSDPVLTEDEQKEAQAQAVAAGESVPKPEEPEPKPGPAEEDGPGEEEGEDEEGEEGSSGMLGGLLSPRKKASKKR